MIKTCTIITLIFAIGICSCGMNKSSKISYKVVDTIFVESVKDSVNVDEYYQGVIHIPGFDSTNKYSCVVGENEIEKVSDGNYMLKVTGTSYDSIPYVSGFDIFMVIRKHTQPGRYTYNGFIREESINGNFVFYPFKASYFVLP